MKELAADARLAFKGCAQGTGGVSFYRYLNKATSNRIIFITT